MGRHSTYSHEIRHRAPVCAVYRANGFVNFRACVSGRERKLVLRLSTGVYERTANFSLPWSKYWLNLQTVSVNKFYFDLKMSERVIISCSDIPEIRQGRETPSLPWTSMHFVLPTSGHDLPCAVLKFTGIPAVTCQPAYPVYGSCGSRNFRQFTHRVTVFTADSEQQCWSHYSIGVYGSKTNFSLPFFKYWF